MNKAKQLMNNYAKSRGYSDWEDLYGQSTDYITEHVEALLLSFLNSDTNKFAYKVRYIPTGEYVSKNRSRRGATLSNVGRIWLNKPNKSEIVHLLNYYARHRRLSINEFKVSDLEIVKFKLVPYDIDN